MHKTKVIKSFQLGGKVMLYVICTPLSIERSMPGSFKVNNAGGGSAAAAAAALKH